MSFENSAETDVVRVEGSSGVAHVRDHDTVGSESSSATNGSSVATVAGKNRFPANPCANPFVGTPAHAIAAATPMQLQRNVNLPMISSMHDQFETSNRSLARFCYAAKPNWDVTAPVVDRQDSGSAGSPSSDDLATFDQEAAGGPRGRAWRR